MGVLKRIREFLSTNAHYQLAGNDDASAKNERSLDQGNGEISKRRFPSAGSFSSINYIAFDLEIAKIILDDFSLWRTNRPLGITCAATLLNGHSPALWYSKYEDGSIAQKMNREDLVKLVEYLNSAAAKGWQILTWNGLSFDFDVLAEESDCWDACRLLAIHHIDLMFHFFCVKGYPLSLNKAAKGMKLAGKLEGMSGDQAPDLWQQGKFQEVMQYVAQDVCTTLEVAKAGIRTGRINWTSNRGYQQSMMLPNGWLSVDKAINLPLPDSSWMSNPMSRDDFIHWTTIVSPTSQTENPSSLKSSDQITTGDPEKSPGPERRSKGTISIYEINEILARCDHFSDLSPFNPYDIETEDVLFECPCPICTGTPNFHPVLEWLEEYLYNAYDGTFEYDEW